MKNFIIRAISGIIFGVMVIGAILLSPITFAVVFGAIMSLTLFEYHNITMGKWGENGNFMPRLFSMIASVSLFVTAFLVCGYNMHSKFLLINVIPVIGLFVSNLYVKRYKLITGNKITDYILEHGISPDEYIDGETEKLIYNSQTGTLEYGYIHNHSIKLERRK